MMVSPWLPESLIGPALSPASSHMTRRASESPGPFHSQFESPFMQIKYLPCSLNSVWCCFHKSPPPQSWPCLVFTDVSEPQDVCALFPSEAPFCPRVAQAWAFNQNCLGGDLQCCLWNGTQRHMLSKTVQWLKVGWEVAKGCRVLEPEESGCVCKNDFLQWHTVALWNLHRVGRDSWGPTTSEEFKQLKDAGRKRGTMM